MLVDYMGCFLKQNQFLFQALVSFSGGIRIGFSFFSMRDLFLKIERFRILLGQVNQLLIRLIKILQAFNGQDHPIVQIGVVL